MGIDFIYSQVALAVVVGKLDGRTPSRTCSSISRDKAGILHVCVVGGSCFLPPLPLGLHPANCFCGCKCPNFCLSTVYDAYLKC